MNTAPLGSRLRARLMRLMVDALAPLMWLGRRSAIAAARKSMIPGPAGPMPARVYTPVGAGPLHSDCGAM